MKILKILFAAIFAICFASSGVAAQIVTKPMTIQKQIQLPTQQEMSKILARDRVRLITLSETDKLKIVNETLKEKGLPTANSLANPVNLSPWNPKQNDDNFLMYFKPWNALVTGNAVQFSGANGWMDSSLGIAYKPPTPGLYLVNLTIRNVNSDGGTEFTSFTIDGKFQQTQKLSASTNFIQNVNFVVNFAQASATTIFVYSNRDWTLYNCEISQIK